MANKFVYSKNLYTLKKNGGLIFCDICKKLVANINGAACRTTQLYICCSCGSHGMFQYSDKLVVNHKTNAHMPDFTDKQYICSKCHSRLFSIITDRVSNYGFYLECSCGEVYNTRAHHSKRLTETIRMFKETIK